MAREIPQVVRAAAGLAATVLDEARKLPETLPGLPVRLIGLAMQQAMKVQQQYAGLVARGDELFTGLRGDKEPGLATFDDDEPTAAPSNGFRDSAFDRAGDPAVDSLPADPAADAVTAVVDELADQVETGRQSIEELAEEAPAIEEILDEIAIDELVDQAPTLEETAPALSLVNDAPATEDADALERALLESDDSPAATDAPVEAEPTADVATTVDVLTPEGEIATVDATVTDEGVAAPEAPGTADADDDTVATTDAAADSTAGTTGARPRKAAKAAKATKATKATKAGGTRARKATKAAAGDTDTTAVDTATTDTTATDTTDTTDTAAAGTDTGTAATDTNAGPATATDGSGSDVAAATGVRTDVGDSDTSDEDTAIAEGAAVGAVGETSAAPTDEPEGGSELSGSQAAGTAPIDGYDSFTIAQLRGRLRGYALSTVADLLAYEEATRAREPYLRMLRNRLEKLEEQAVEASPLAPRGA
ncbi:hypothetical protein [Blastococcus deserti]|uniref:Lipid droplet-associated protein n=1 Tax=Blastococcus deserti TaxID=2259033 RepID=A0ABW4XB78_9ACTN